MFVLATCLEGMNNFISLKLQVIDSFPPLYICANYHILLMASLIDFVKASREGTSYFFSNLIEMLTMNKTPTFPCSESDLAKAIWSKTQVESTNWI